MLFIHPVPSEITYPFFLFFLFFLVFVYFDGFRAAFPKNLVQLSPIFPVDFYASYMYTYVHNSFDPRRGPL